MNALSHSDQTPFSDIDSLSHTGIAAYKRCGADTYAAIDRNRRRDMAMIGDHRIMLNQGLTVDDATAPHYRGGIDHGPMHDDGAGAQCGVRRHIGARRHDDGQNASAPLQQVKKTYSGLRRLDLPDRDQSMSIIAK